MTLIKRLLHSLEKANQVIKNPEISTFAVLNVYTTGQSLVCSEVLFKSKKM